MAISNLNLNVTANTARALADFNKFSRSLDNKFLISGLKLDVVRNALSQINRDFQRAIGEQGLASATSLRAAQNQAALLTQTFKNFSSESAKAITRDIGTALNKVAVTAGGTMKDVQKSLSASSFISTALPESVRKQMAVDIMKFNRDLRRAGMGDNFGGIAQQFLTGQASGQQLMQTGGAVESFLGKEIIRRTGGSGMAQTAEQRSRILGDILSDPEIQKQLQEMAKNASGFRIILEDLNTKLFNTESGVFGALRKVIDKTGKSTTMFDEVYKIVDQVFGPNGMFRAIFNSIREVFKIGDPMRPFIDAIQFFTGVFKQLTDYFNSSGFKGILFIVEDVFYRIREVFTGIYEQVTSGSFDPDEIVGIIRGIGTRIREYIQEIGQKIRGENINKQTSFVAEIGATLLEEIGKTSITLIRELFITLVNKVPEISSQVLPALNRGINELLDETFGGFSKVIKPLLATLPGPLGAVARSSMITDVTGGQGGLGLLGAAAPFLLAGGGGLRGTAGNLFTGTGRGATAFRTLGLGLTGLDPTLSLLGGFAPQLLGNVPGVARRLLETPGRVMGTGPGRFLINRGESLFNLLGRGISRTGGFIGQGAATASGYLGAVGPTLQGAGSSAQNYYNSVAGFARGQSSQFMAGFRPPFPNVAVGAGTTPAFRARQFIRNVPSNASNIFRNTLSALSNLGPSLVNLANPAATSIASVGSKLGSSIVSLGKVVASQTVFALLEIQRATRMFSMGLSGSALFTRGRPMVQAGMMLRGAAPGLLAGGSIALGSQLLGNAIGGSGGQQVSGLGAVLGGGISGAAMGAQIGSIIPGIGTAAGAIIGGVIGGVAPLLDKGVREGVGKFASGLGNSMRTMGSELLKSIGEFFNGILNPLRSLPSMISGIMKWIYNSIPAPIRSTISGAGNLWSGFTSWVSNIRIPGIFYNGKDYYGPAMALESRMSGRRPMVVNDGEFVIPKDGFATLSGIVADNIRTTGIQRQSDSSSTQVNMSLTLHVNSVVADPNELARVLKEPVYKIMGDAWMEAKNSVMTNRARVN